VEPRRLPQLRRTGGVPLELDGAGEGIIECRETIFDLKGEREVIIESSELSPGTNDRQTSRRQKATDSRGANKGRHVNDVIEQAEDDGRPKGHGHRGGDLAPDD
jgi:hypothetical protein